MEDRLDTAMHTASAQAQQCPNSKQTLIDSKSIPASVFPGVLPHVVDLLSYIQ